MNAVRRMAVWLGICLTIISMGAASVMAESVYVTDSFMVGLHKDNQPDSAIVKLMPSSTPLEVLARDGGFVRVRDRTGNEGWIDSAYVTDKPPTAGLAGQFEQRAKASAEQVQKALAGERAAREQLSKLQAEMGRLREGFARREAEMAKSNLAELEELQAKLVQIEAAAPHPGDTAPDPARQREMQHLAAENQTLKETINNLRATPEPTVAPRTVVVVRAFGVADIRWWMWLLAGCSLLLCFAVGAFIIDWDVRRRHGGFRV